MAEQEACATAVTEALVAAGEAAAGDEATGDADGEARGESLLLPLLQGLLGEAGGRGGARLAAGLGAAGADVLADVRRSLARLRRALAPPAAHPQAGALLALAERLEDALDAADRAERLDGCKRRARRRRAARHTVGVTREELEQARRLVDRTHLALQAAGEERADEDDAPLATPPPQTPQTPQTPETPHSFMTTVTPMTSAPLAPEIMQNGNSTIDEEVRYHDAVSARAKAAPLVQSASFQSVPRAGPAAPPVERRTVPRRPDHFRHTIADAVSPQPQPPSPQPYSLPRRPSDSRSGIAAIANKFNAQVEKDMTPVRRLPMGNRQPAPVAIPPPAQRAPTAEEAKRSFYRPLPPTYNFAAPPAAEEPPKTNGRFDGGRRARYKRANTIDIGRPLGGYRPDGESDEDAPGPRRAPLVPEFRPQTENDKKFLAFMQRTERTEGGGGGGGHANWSNRFGNIKHTFESRERDDRTRSAGAVTRRAWRPPAPPEPRAPWLAERRAPPPAPLLSPGYPSTPASPAKPVVVKPFIAKPIPVNQFSHAPMSPFKPPKKIASPIDAPPCVWSPPSAGGGLVSPANSSFPFTPLKAPSPPVPAPPPHVPWSPEIDKPKRVLSLAARKFENNTFEPKEPRAPVPPYKSFGYRPVASPPGRSPTRNYPVNPIPSQNDLAAPELVKQITPTAGRPEDPPEVFPKIDVQKAQIQFYERQIREKQRREAVPTGPRAAVGRDPPATASAPPKPTYTVTDYTPADVISTFVPLQRTPDIEKPNAHKVAYLPDVVMNENEYGGPAPAPGAAAPRAGLRSPRSPHGTPYALQNGHALTNGTGGGGGGAGGHAEGEATEHSSVVTRVMRGPVCGAATITAGVRTRHEPGPAPRAAAHSLKGTLEKLSSPLALADRRRTQVRPPAPPPVQNGLTPPPPAECAPATVPPCPRSPASRDSLASEGSSGGPSPAPGPAPLSRSESWQRAPSPRVSPRRVVSRAKSMHLLAAPKLFEGGIARDQLGDKRRTVEAYFSGRAAPSPAPAPAPTPAPAPAPARAARPARYSLGRSRTMPSVSELQFLDESNADDAFEDLVSALA